MSTETKVLTDENSGAPIVTAQLPASFQVHAKLEAVNCSGLPAVRIFGTAMDAERHMDLFFESGDGYTDAPQNPGVMDNQIHMELCSAEDQLNFYVGRRLRKQSVHTVSTVFRRIVFCGYRKKDRRQSGKI